MRAAPEDRLDAFAHATDDAIVAEAMSEAKRAPTYDELWGVRPLVEMKAPEPHSRAPMVTAIVATLIGAMALVALREKIVRVAPPMALGFAAIGLPVNLDGLELRGVRSRIVMDGAKKVLAIEGEIANARREPMEVPQLALTVRGDDGLAKYAWTSPAPKSRLEPGEMVVFRARLASPPASGADVLVRFAALEEAGRAKTVRR
jgi:hypothetical protein